MTAPLPVIVCIDVEPELRAVDPEAPIDWVGFERATETLGRLRPPLGEVTRAPVHFAWFLRMDPQVEHVYGSADWVVSRYGSEIRSLEEAGDAIGLHIHPWRWEQATRGWIADFACPEWGEECVRVGFSSFEKALGRACREVRFGDRWLTNGILAAAEQWGARYDLSAEPGKTPVHPSEPHAGLMPDYATTPRHPFHPSRDDFNVPSNEPGRPLQIIPLTTGRIDWAHRVWEDKAAERQRECSRHTEGAYHGWVDKANIDVTAGWVFDAQRPDQTIEIEVYDNDGLVAVVPAALYRPDLVKAGIGNGRHTFGFPWGNRLRDGRQHEIRIRAAGTSFELAGSPKVVQCRDNEEPVNDYKALDLGDDPSIMGALLEAVVSTHACSCLVYVVRTSIFSCPEEEITVERNLMQLMTLAESYPLALMTPAEASKALAEGLRKPA